MERLDYIVMIVTFSPLLYMYYDYAEGDVDSFLVYVLLCIMIPPLAMLTDYVLLYTK